MQAIILAAGMGKRLGEFTQNNTKCMVEVNGVKLIDRVLCQLMELNLNRVIIVVGYEGQKLIDYLTPRYQGKIELQFKNNPIYDKTNNIYSLSLVKDELREDDTLLLESDIIFEDKMLKLLIESPDPSVALVAKYESWMDGTMVCIDEDRNITNFITKEAFKYENIGEYYKTVNIYKFSKEFSCKQYVPFMEAYLNVVGRNEYYEQVLRVLCLLHHSEMKALPVGDIKWYEIDDIQDLDIASTVFARSGEKINSYKSRYGGFWRFPQMLDYCYLVNPFFPSKRMKAELKSNFEELLTEYPSGMRVISLLAGKYFGVNQSRIIVGNGAAELIKLYMESYTTGKVGVVYPTFDEYPNRLCADDIIAFIPQNEDFRYTTDDLMTFFSDKDLSTLLLINPDNPSGNYIPRNDLEVLAHWSQSIGIKLLIDESFVDFTGDPIGNTLIKDDFLRRFPNISVMKSISKSFGVPGLRLGVLASGDTKMIAQMKKDVSIWNINSFAEYYLQIFGKYQKDYDRACALFVKERERFYELLKEIPYLRVMPSQANYFLCEVIGGMTSHELAEKLIEHDVIISDCGKKSKMNGRNLIRLAVRGKEDNDRLIEILRTI